MPDRFKETFEGFAKAELPIVTSPIEVSGTILRVSGIRLETKSKVALHTNSCESTSIENIQHHDRLIFKVVMVVKL